MKITKEELENIVVEVVSDVYAIDEKLPTELRPADRQVRKKLRQLDPGDPDYPSTVGELKHLLRLIRSSKNSDELAKVLSGSILDLVSLGQVSTIKNLKNIYNAPDEKKTNTDLDKLNIDDEISKIVDDTIENNFINYLIKSLNSGNLQDNDPIPDVGEWLRRYLKKNYNKRTITGFPARSLFEESTSNTGDSTMKITQQELMDIIREEITQIDCESNNSEEEMRRDKLDGMIEGAAMAKMDEVISMISNHLVTTMGEADDRKLVRRALDMLEELGFKGLKPADAEKMIGGDEE